MYLLLSTSTKFFPNDDFTTNEEIKEDMRNHPDLRKMIDERRSTKDELHFTNGSWIKATGVGAAIRGEHPAIVALDDVLADLWDTSMDTATE